MALLLYRGITQKPESLNLQYFRLFISTTMYFFDIACSANYLEKMILIATKFSNRSRFKASYIILVSACHIIYNIASLPLTMQAYTDYKLFHIVEH